MVFGVALGSAGAVLNQTVNNCDIRITCRIIIFFFFVPHLLFYTMLPTQTVLFWFF